MIWIAGNVVVNNRSKIGVRSAPLPPITLILSALAICALFAAFDEVELAKPLAEKHDSLLPGLTTESRSPPSLGLVVTSVRNQSEAQRDGVAVGDDILQVNDLPANNGKSRNFYLSKGASGLLRLQLLHDGEVRNVVLHAFVR